MGRKKVTAPHDEDYRLFGQKLSELRNEKGLSQEKIAEELEIPKTTYSGYETGSRKIPLSILKKLSNYFDKSVDELLGLNNAKNYEGVNTNPNNAYLSDHEKKLIIEYRQQPNAQEFIDRALGIKKEDTIAKNVEKGEVTENSANVS